MPKNIRLFIGTDKGAFVCTSDEARKNWSIEGPFLKGWNVSSITPDRRTNPYSLWAGVGHFVYGPTVQKSTDFGKTWTVIEHGPKYAEGAPGKLNAIWTVTPGRPSQPKTLFAGVADAGLFRSDDNGDHWSEVAALSGHPTRSEWSPGAGGLCAHTILLHPSNANRMWVGISAVGVFRSDDDGKSFHVKNKGLNIVLESKKEKEIGSCVHRLTLDPRNPDRLYQQNHRGVYRSTNGGDSWDMIENGLPKNTTETCFGFPMVVHPHDSDTVFIAPIESDEYRFMRDGQVAVYRTRNGGDSWEKLTTGLPGNHYVGVLRLAMCADDCEDAGIYFGTTSGEIFYSRDAGDHWDKMPLQLPRVTSVAATVTDA